MDTKLADEVRRRAGDQCEYCHFPQAWARFTLWVDHVVPEKHHGKTEFANLALSCGHCNQHKGTNLSGIDPESGRVTELFNPRTMRWNDHFRWDGPMLIGHTDIGRATVDVLAINRLDRVWVRIQLTDSGDFPRDFEIRLE